MTIDEAIRHCEEVAEQNEKKAEYRPRMDYYDEIESRTDCLECAAEHRQIVEYLTELKELRVKFIQLEKDYVELEEINSKHMWETDNLLDEIREDCRTIMELKKFLIIAMNDMETIYEAGKDEGCYGIKFKWRYNDKALQLIGDDYNDVVKMIGDELCGKNDND